MYCEQIRARLSFSRLLRSGRRARRASSPAARAATGRDRRVASTGSRATPRVRAFRRRRNRSRFEPVAGGQLVVSVRTEPQSFNRLARRDSSSDLVSSLINARLVRINRVTQEVEPWLAESWTRSDDGLRYTMRLRPGVVFADGHPFTADDVVFTFRALYDERAATVLADALAPAGQPLTVTATDPLTVVIAFAEPFAPGLRLLDNLPILPKHKLEAALDAGTFGSAWDLGTAVTEITGLGPFMVSEYLPGQRAGADQKPALLQEGCRRHAAAVSRSRDRRDRSGPERRAAAARVGRHRHDHDRDAARRLRPAQARRRRREGAAARSRSRLRRRQLLDQPEAGRHP